MSSNPTYTSLGHYKLPASHSVICGRTEYYGNHASHPWSYHSRTEPGNGTTLAKRQGSPRRSERRSLSISCCILSRWPEATGQALPVLLHLECTVQRRDFARNMYLFSDSNFRGIFISYDQFQADQVKEEIKKFLNMYDI